ncbi:hypothetical protein [Arenimonas oryziterrae]|uniref:Uncharacterized protein n=1 Tax=Arenimonas oryziterrae DSM 21050 = YC6267 TaxID=1121015 RepID=A0A091AVY0_9GAMM|nr:hypothetical protein [Arenimonas oryziterrae]KFN43601.1 hypothetical protein N789_10015 [Arenimonas oryziterrae DSM 21050 = YC6267]
MPPSRKHEEARNHERRQVAAEAARLMATTGLRDFQQAKLKAAHRLGISNEASLPRNAEIEAQLRDYQRLFQGQQQPQELHARRAAAIDAMIFFERFQPRLVGPVLEGTADAHSPVSLHLFAEDADTVARHLIDAGIPALPQSRRLRLDRERESDFPVWSFSVDDLAFELTVLPPALLRQAPLGPLDDKPMPRATLAALRTLLAGEASGP